MFDSTITFWLPYALTFIAVIAALVIGLMIYIKLANDKQPILTLNATVVSKDVEFDTTSFSSTNFGTGKTMHSPGASFKHKYYHLTFQTGEGSRRRFFVSKNEYQRLTEGDQGSLTYQGGRYLGFKIAEASE
jgi:hypothetical protein